MEVYLVSFAVEVFDPVVVEDTKRQPRLLVDPLGILPHVCFLLYSLEFPEQED